MPELEKDCVSEMISGGDVPMIENERYFKDDITGKNHYFYDSKRYSMMNSFTYQNPLTIPFMINNQLRKDAIIFSKGIDFNQNQKINDLQPGRPYTAPPFSLSGYELRTPYSSEQRRTSISNDIINSIYYNEIKNDKKLSSPPPPPPPPPPPAPLLPLVSSLTSSSKQQQREQQQQQQDLQHQQFEKSEYESKMTLDPIDNNTRLKGQFDQIYYSEKNDVTPITHIPQTNSWHPHVYAKPPQKPTPHSICDILGLNRSFTKNNGSNNNNENATVMIKHEKSSSEYTISESRLKSPNSIINDYKEQFSNQVRRFDNYNNNILRNTSLSEASEDDSIQGEQPLNLSVAKDRSNSPLRNSNKIHGKIKKGMNSLRIFSFFLIYI